MILQAAEVIVHPNFNSINLRNNIAIIKFSADATLNNYVQPVCLWKSDKTDLSEVVGKLGTVVGWGVTETGELSKVLLQANMPVVNALICLQSNRNFFGRFLSDTSFCAGFRNGLFIRNILCGGTTFSLFWFHL